MSIFVPWKVLNIELSEGIPLLPTTPNYQGLYTVFWWRGIPLGHQEILGDQLPMQATQLKNIILEKIAPALGDRLLEQGFKAALPDVSPNPFQNQCSNLEDLIALERPLEQLEKRFSQPLCSSVSVIICTRDRADQLVKCLFALQNLSTPPKEIIVVDNAPSSDATRQLVSEMPAVRYVLEPKPGLSVARNTGIRHSTGEIIAFTDDDVEVHPDWIARLQQGFSDPKVMAVTGLVLPAELETEAQFIFEKNNSFSQGYRVLTFDSEFFETMKPLGVPVWRIGAGANMALRKKAFELVGDFDERLGAGASGCSEDSEFWYRLLAEGWVCRYEPAAVVYHYHRSDLKGLKHQMFQYMRGHVAALLVQFAKYKHWGNLYRLFVILPKYYAKFFLSAVLKASIPKIRQVVGEISACFSGIVFYLQNRSLIKSLKP
ncbi:glycosyltransferase family 2 protein [Microcoleus sp. FACHB-672]|uniref:glycosyltransferase family 2 protein n=1 Tax=Microcoleus sp. FACHB-672 TaxID=2692825 RepID=UPI002815ECBB|nr:glycosyltransferase [Microcoleus sp. FACHB-672]